MTCRSLPTPSSNHGDGQTNWIKFIPFVCPSQVHASLPTPSGGSIDFDFDFEFWLCSCSTSADGPRLRLHFDRCPHSPLSWRATATIIIQWSSPSGPPFAALSHRACANLTLPSNRCHCSIASPATLLPASRHRRHRPTSYDLDCPTLRNPWIWQHALVCSRLLSWWILPQVN